MPPLEIQVFSPSSTQVSPSLARGHIDVRDVGTGFRLGQGEGGDRLARACLLQPRALLGRAEEGDRARAEALHGEGEIGQSVVAGERFAREAERAHIRARRCHFPARVCASQPSRPRRATSSRQAASTSRVIDGQVRRAPFLQRGLEGAVAVLEERPGEEARVRHQSPSNAGFCLATKAR